VPRSPVEGRRLPGKEYLFSEATQGSFCALPGFIFQFLAWEFRYEDHLNREPAKPFQDTCLKSTIKFRYPYEYQEF
jgi:hypothetical protein